MGEDNHRYCQWPDDGSQGASGPRPDDPAGAGRTGAEGGAGRAGRVHVPTIQTRHLPARAAARRRPRRLEGHGGLHLRRRRLQLIAVDTNILVYACNETSPMHERALAAMDRLVSEPAWGLPWIVAGEFYSTLTNGRQWREPQGGAALAALDAWRAT